MGIREQTLCKHVCKIDWTTSSIVVNEHDQEDIYNQLETNKHILLIATIKQGESPIFNTIHFMSHRRFANATQT
jgi:hypothetical protein